jgi:hypothetical protein
LSVLLGILLRVPRGQVRYALRSVLLIGRKARSLSFSLSRAARELREVATAQSQRRDRETEIANHAPPFKGPSPPNT